MSRKRDEVKQWTSEDNPISRLRLFLEARSLWDEAREKQMDAEIRKGLFEAFQVCTLHTSHGYILADTG